ncbi:MAG: class I SAM-dependent methyltransferase, partial [Actinobacteria bacterium]|nr:class I SAM-dependent methyltransferase [Actinomycetota bacterium]
STGGRAPIRQVRAFPHHGATGALLCPAPVVCGDEARPAMNAKHLEFCASAEWAEIIEREVLPWAVGDRDLGDDVLEVGAGPGLTTDVLRQRVPRLTAVEIDRQLAAALRARLDGGNVTVVEGDATRLPLESDRFSAATTFNMLHHVPSVELQDRVLAELCRVLRPGGILIGTDGIASDTLDEFHVGDVYVPCDPAGMPARLAATGFVDVHVDRADLTATRLAWARSRFRFVATAP